MKYIITLIIAAGLAMSTSAALAQDAGLEPAADVVPDPTEDPGGFVATITDLWSGGLWMPIVGAMLIGIAGVARKFGPRIFDGAKGAGLSIALATVLTAVGPMLVRQEFDAELLSVALTAIAGAVALFLAPPRNKKADVASGVLS